jgi:hypothetical protein
VVVIDNSKYWTVVRDLICAIYGMGTNDASRLVASLAEISNDSVYENEPFFLACALRGDDANIRSYSRLILQIYEQHGL